MIVHNLIFIKGFLIKKPHIIKSVFEKPAIVLCVYLSEDYFEPKTQIWSKIDPVYLQILGYDKAVIKKSMHYQAGHNLSILTSFFPHTQTDDYYNNVRLIAKDVQRII